MQTEEIKSACEALDKVKEVIRYKIAKDKADKSFIRVWYKGMGIDYCCIIDKWNANESFTENITHWKLQSWEVCNANKTA